MSKYLPPQNYSKERQINWNLETGIKQNTDDVGTSTVYCLFHMCHRYLHHRHFVLFWFPIYLAFFRLVLRRWVLGSTLSTRWNKKLNRKLVFRGYWRIKTFNLFRMPPCWDVGTRWYLHRLYTSDTCTITCSVVFFTCEAHIVSAGGVNQGKQRVFSR